MKSSIISIVLSGIIGLSAIGQTTSPQAVGYIDRAAQMLSDKNYIGCIDQCTTALKLGTATPEQAMWLKATAAFLGGIPQASTSLNEFCAKFPASPNVPTARFYLATIVFYDGDYPQALNMLDAIRANSLESQTADLLVYRRAYCQMQTGDFGKAQKGFSQLTKSSQFVAPANYYLGYISYLKDDYEDAEKCLKEVPRTSVLAPRADCILAQIAFKRGDFDEALSIAQPLLGNKDLEPSYIEDAQLIVGESLYALGNESSVKKYLRPYLSTHPDAPLSARYIVGCDDYAIGSYNDAIALLAPVTDLDDAMGQSAAFTLGQAYLAIGNPQGALMSFEKAIKTDADAGITEAAYYNYAVATVDGGRIPFGSTAKTLEDFVKRYPRSAYASTVTDYLIKGYIHAEDYAGALRSLNTVSAKQSKELQPVRQRVLFMLGTRALNSGDAVNAVGYLNEAESLGQNDASIALQTAYWLGDAEQAIGRYGDAESHYRKFLAKATYANANRGMALYNMGYAQFAQKKYVDARKSFMSALDTNTLTDAIRMDALNRIADTEYYGGDFKKAMSKYQEAFDIDPAGGDYPLFQISMMEGHMRDNDKKIVTLTRFAGLFPQSTLRPQALTEKALAQSALHRQADAIATYESIVAAYPQTRHGRNALLQLAIINDNAGNTDKAISYYRNVIIKHPTSSEATLAVNDLKRIYGQRGEIEVLDQLLESTEGAPKLDAVERNAIMADVLLRKARAATTDDTRLDLATQLLQKYPDSEDAEEALAIAANAQYKMGLSQQALKSYTQLEAKASTPTMRHAARMGMMRAGRDMGDHDVVAKVTEQILQTSTTPSTDMLEAKYIRSGALKVLGRADEARRLLDNLSADTSSLYGTRAAYDIAEAYFSAGNLKEAEQRVSKLIDDNPPHPYWLARAYVLLSDVLRAQGSDFEADEYLKALRDNYPGTDADIFRMIEQRLAR